MASSGGVVNPDITSGDHGTLPSGGVVTLPSGSTSTVGGVSFSSPDVTITALAPAASHIVTVDVMDTMDDGAPLPSMDGDAPLPSMDGGAPLPSTSTSTAPRSYSSAVTSQRLQPKSNSMRAEAAALKPHVRRSGNEVVLEIPVDSPAGTSFTTATELGVCFEALPDTPLKMYSTALKQKFSPSAIRHMSRRGPSVIVYFFHAADATSVLQTGLVVGDHQLFPEPVAQRPVTVSMYPVHPEVTDAMLCAFLMQSGRVVGNITTHSAAPKDEDDRSIESARRVARVVFSSDEHIKSFPTLFTVKCGDQIRRIDVLTSFHCQTCKAYGHQRSECFRRPAVPQSSGPKVTRDSPVSSTPTVSKEVSSELHQPALPSGLPPRGPAPQLLTEDFPHLVPTAPPTFLAAPADLTADLHPPSDEDTPSTVTDMDCPTASDTSGNHSDPTTTSKPARRESWSAPQTPLPPRIGAARGRSVDSSSRSSSQRRTSPRTSRHPAVIPGSKTPPPVLSLDSFLRYLAEAKADIPVGPLSLHKIYEVLCSHKHPRFFNQFVARHLLDLPTVLTQVSSVISVYRNLVLSYPDLKFSVDRMKKQAKKITDSSARACRPGKDLPIQGGHT